MSQDQKNGQTAMSRYRPTQLNHTTEYLSSIGLQVSFF